ncbi:MAG: cytochrome c, partial [Flammeovirgaceae bacterium]|nr:cytochrome c [Flammeovirgaceae bacterium]MDW8288665.1 cytochrome c [Flammeovirgaceae bacterium]
MKKAFVGIFMLTASTLFLIGCGAGGNDPGTEYAPQMYHSVAYEPLSQITKDGIPTGIISSRYYTTNSLPYNDYNGAKPMNMKKPVEGTVKRQYYRYVKNEGEATKSPLLIYELHKDSIELAGRILKNPTPNTPEVVARGKELYLSYCSPCHGEKGDGKGKVGEVYQGVPNYSAGRYKTLTEGWIFHTITH